MSNRHSSMESSKKKCMWLNQRGMLCKARRTWYTSCIRRCTASGKHCGHVTHVLTKSLKKLGFIKCTQEHAVYTRGKLGVGVIIDMYVDDLIVTGEDATTDAGRGVQTLVPDH